MHGWLALAELPWPQIAGAVVAMGGIIPLAIWIARQVMRPYFVTAGTHTQLEQRVAAVEALAREAATKSDLREVNRRLADVERSSIANGEGIKSLGDGLRRIEHMVDLLYRNALADDGKR